MKATDLIARVSVDKGRTSEILGAMADLAGALARLNEAQVEVDAKMTVLAGLFRSDGLVNVTASPPNHADGT